MEAQAADWGFWQFVINAAALGISGAAFLIALWVKHKQITRESITELESQLKVLKIRVDSVPTSQAWGEMNAALAGIRGDVHVTAEGVKGLGKGLERVERQVSMLMEHELNKGSTGKEKDS